MSESNATHFVKQVWRQKGDALFDHIPFKEENKATDLSQTTRPVLVLETKSNGGSGTVFAIGRVTEASVVEKAIEYPNGEFLYHVPFAYDLILEDKKNGITREELQELTGQKFAPQVKGGLYEITAAHYEQLVAILHERNAGTVAAAGKATTSQASKAQASVAKATETLASATGATEGTATAAKASAPAASVASKATAVVNTGLADVLQATADQLGAQPHLRVMIEAGQVSYYPAVLLGLQTDLVQLQETVAQYIQAGGDASIDAAAAEAAAAGATAPRVANVLALVERLVREGKYEAVQTPTLQKAFYRGATNLPHPYEAIELQGTNGHHVLGLNGTLYTVDGKRVQHFLGL